jgi:hypothetical protein
MLFSTAFLRLTSLASERPFNSAIFFKWIFVFGRL